MATIKIDFASAAHIDAKKASTANLAAAKHSIEGCIAACTKSNLNDAIEAAKPHLQALSKLVEECGRVTI